MISYWGWWQNRAYIWRFEGRLWKMLSHTIVAQFSRGFWTFYGSKYAIQRVKTNGKALEHSFKWTGNLRAQFLEYITRMIMNLFGFEKSVIKFGLLIQFTQRNLAHIKREQKCWNLRWFIFCRIETFSGKNKLSLQQNIMWKIESRETFNPARSVGNHRSTRSDANIMIT